MKLLYIFTCLTILLISNNICKAADLPTLGQDVRLLLTLPEEQKIGAAWMRQLNATNAITYDQTINEYIQELGNSLTDKIPGSEYQYNFYVIKNKTLNAFAFLGGYVVVHDGLILTTKHESELAAVVAHEISHIKHYHIIRQVAESNKILPLTMAGALASILVGAPELIIPVIQGHSQKMITFSRDHEKEADYFGIQLMNRAGYNPHAMADIFTQMDVLTRTRNKPPEYLMSHPIFERRIADAQNRANKFQYKQKSESINYKFIKAKIEMNYSNLNDTVSSLEKDLNNSRISHDFINQYKLAYGYILQHKPNKAIPILTKLGNAFSLNPIIQLTLTQAMYNNNQQSQSLEKLRKLNDTFPQSKSIAIQLAEYALIQNRAIEAKEVLLNIQKLHPNEPTIYRLLSQSYSSIGDKLRMYINNAEWLFLNNDTASALVQLDQALELSLDDTFEHNKIKTRKQQILDANKKKI